jgi:LacI family transcriptional regulator
MFDRVAHDVLCDKVIVDDFDATYNATKGLLLEGRKNISLISSIDDLSVGKLRERGYNKAILENNTQLPLVLKISKLEDSQLKIKTFFENNKMDGVIAADSASGVIAINTAINFGLNVPKDISVIGFSSKYISNHCIPKLTTIRQHAKDIGANAAELLIKRLQNKNMSETDVSTLIIKTSLIKNGSTL